jgi:hypothetical protein
MGAASQAPSFELEPEPKPTMVSAAENSPNPWVEAEQTSFEMTAPIDLQPQIISALPATPATPKPRSPAIIQLTPGIARLQAEEDEELEAARVAKEQARASLASARIAGRKATEIKQRAQKLQAEAKLLKDEKKNHKQASVHHDRTYAKHARAAQNLTRQYQALILQMEEFKHEEMLEERYKDPAIRKLLNPDKRGQFVEDFLAGVMEGKVTFEEIEKFEKALDQVGNEVLGRVDANEEEVRISREREAQARISMRKMTLSPHRLRKDCVKYCETAKPPSKRCNCSWVQWLATSGRDELTFDFKLASEKMLLAPRLERESRPVVRKVFREFQMMSQCPHFFANEALR